MIKGITPKICMLCFVVINSVILNLLCFWVFSSQVCDSEQSEFGSWTYPLSQSSPILNKPVSVDVKCHERRNRQVTEKHSILYLFVDYICYIKKSNSANDDVPWPSKLGHWVHCDKNLFSKFHVNQQCMLIKYLKVPAVYNLFWFVLLWFVFCSVSVCQVHFYVCIHVHKMIAYKWLLFSQSECKMWSWA